MADWYVFQYDAAPLGPMSTELIADAILGGRLSAETWVAAPGGPKWLRALDVPVIARLVKALPEQGPRRRDSGLRMMPQALLREPAPTPALGVFAVSDPAPETDPMSPSSFPTRRAYYGGGETLESAGNERRRTRKRT